MRKRYDRIRNVERARANPEMISSANRRRRYDAIEQWKQHVPQVPAYNCDNGRKFNIF